MSIIGKVVGAIIGYLITRKFMGAIIGAVLGHTFDQRVTSARQGVVGTDFLNPLFAFAGAVSKADGRVSVQEIAAAKALMQRMQLDEAQRSDAIDAFNAGKQAGYAVETAIANLRVWTQGRRDRGFVLLDMLLDIVYAEGALAEPKKVMIRRLCAAIGISEADLAALSAMKGYGHFGDAGRWSQGAGGSRQAPGAPHAPVDDPYAVLGLDRNASSRDLKVAWRRLMSQHHPDKLGNVPDELKRRAETRARDINAAYERIKNERGLP
ncbi:MAG: co-chaperone DjlA [Dokdonella sp.]